MSTMSLADRKALDLAGPITVETTIGNRDSEEHQALLPVTADTDIVGFSATNGTIRLHMSVCASGAVMVTASLNSRSVILNLLNLTDKDLYERVTAATADYDRERAAWEAAGRQGDWPDIIRPDRRSAISKELSK